MKYNKTTTGFLLLWALTAACFLAFAHPAHGQVSACLKFEMPVLHVNVGDTVEVPMRVYGFEAIAAIQFSMKWVPGALEFVSLETGALQSLSAANFNATGNRIHLSWFDPNTQGVTLPDGSVIFALRMRVLSNNPAAHLIIVDENTPSIPIEVVQFNPPSGVIPVAFEYGGVWTAGNPPIDLQWNNACTTSAGACNQSDGSVSVSVSGGLPPYTYSWSGPNGFSASNANISNLGSGLYFLTVTDQLSNVSTGVFQVTQPGTPLVFSSYVVPTGCAQNDGCITITVESGKSPFTYTWSPSLPNTGQLCGLSPGAYHVTVTDANGCFGTDSLYVAGGDSLSISVFTTDATCASGQTGTAAVFPQNGTAPYSYLWSQGSTTPVIQGLNPGVYEITVTDNVGCTGVAQAQIEDASGLIWGLHADPVCPTPGNPEGYILLLADNPGTITFPLTVQWSNGTTTIVPAASGDTLDVLTMAPSGAYSVVATDSLGCYQFLQTTLTCFGPPPVDSDAWVWPGDADNNNAVNHHDLLYLGLAYGTSGPVRPSATLDWAGQPAPDWSQSTQHRSVNYKNMDTNGDGVVNAADTLAIVVNWAQVIDPSTDNPFAVPVSVPGMAPTPAPTLSFMPDTLTPGQIVGIPMVLGSPGAPADSLTGLAFSISYDPDIMHPLYFEPQASWFGDPASDLLCVQRHFPGQHRLDVALTRTAGGFADGYGVIGRTFIVIEDDIFFRKKGSDENESGSGNGDGILTSRLFLRNVLALTPSNSQAEIASPVGKVVIRQTVAAPEIENYGYGVQLSPNPASKVVTVRSPEASIISVHIFDMLGQMRLAWMGRESLIQEFSVQDLAPGAYLMQIQTAKGSFVKTFIRQ